ncbi:fimbrial protein [Luteibacter jiangsuensis]|uniref:Fimbrial protein n=1 Tax=Luteibacter jiangsuensis TaxID=637577 RepID=A0ABX0Q2U3_9GAMM|nr:MULTISPECIES: fimbrial protein [Luteibacter]NID04702.1 fimbrial protein [Luteibacter jiangsuensis]NII55596.1 hypothetical protein [Luteibacter sp. SG786]
MRNTCITLRIFASLFLLACAFASSHATAATTCDAAPSSKGSDTGTSITSSRRSFGAREVITPNLVNLNWLRSGNGSTVVTGGFQSCSEGGEDTGTLQLAINGTPDGLTLIGNSPAITFDIGNPDYLVAIAIEASSQGRSGGWQWLNNQSLTFTAPRINAGGSMVFNTRAILVSSHALSPPVDFPSSADIGITISGTATYGGTTVPLSSGPLKMQPVTFVPVTCDWSPSDTDVSFGDINILGLETQPVTKPFNIAANGCNAESVKVSFSAVPNMEDPTLFETSDEHLGLYIQDDNGTIVAPGNTRTWPVNSSISHTFTATLKKTGTAPLTPTDSGTAQIKMLIDYP